MHVTADIPRRENRIVRILFGTLIVFGIIAVIASLYIAYLVGVQVPAQMSERAALWNVTDAIQRYVMSTRQWPSDWQCLQPHLVSIDAMAYCDGDITFATQRVDVNFSVKIHPSVPLYSDSDHWHVRLKSGRMPSEQQAANDRLRDFLSRLCGRNSPPNLEKETGTGGVGVSRRKVANE
jgi:hypothetical protein